MYYLFIPLFLLDSPCLQILFCYKARIGMEFYGLTGPEDICHLNDWTFYE